MVIRRLGLLSIACVALAAASFVAPSSALAADVEQLSIAYTNAVRGYEDALAEQEQNTGEIEALNQEIEAVEQSMGRAQGELDETAVALYKGTRAKNALVELLLGSENFQDAVERYELYEKVERRCAERVGELVAEREGLDGQKAELEERKAAIEAKVTEAKRVADEAEKALFDATRADGAKYHQRQGNGHNCGATAFIVGVNILLHEKRFTDNVAVWEGPGFERDSTQDLASKGATWLEANDLGDEIGIEAVPGDVSKASELKSLLDDGKLVIISSGPDSVWHLADGTTAKPGSHSSGHWIVFYRCEGGVFFCNDSSASKKKGAGCPYTEEQMQQWLDGRSYHFATVLYKK